MSKANYIYGIHAVTALLKENPERIRQLLVQTGRQDTHMAACLQQARNAGISVQTLPRQTLDQLAEGGVHQGIIANVLGKTQLSEADLYPLLDTLSHSAFLLVLDGVQDPHNLGACLRSANAAGVDAVIVPKDRSATLTPTAYKAASGAAEVTPLIMVTNLVRTLQQLKQRGIWVYGTSDQAQSTIYTADWRGAIAVVLGAEGEGLRRLTQETCDALYAIPMHGTVSSLNVSVAAGVCLFEAVRQRG